ncbi:BREX-2 system phosphatase PglZ [Gordonia sp. PP30]|uniref:BREX-2 system phosphatase PglZ n=1 Tax=Gordonia sp. PP30 TaxID=2935861 RepID=UPI001FFE477E|nr:BREX-2 system phosphatase PglZ [Gordonia sp. PP30]UQE73805.1 BREX-2 system phosphatase PglZ [Gordonia sp. PP30]
MTPLPRADLTGLLTLIGQLREKGHQRGVLAVAARPEWDGDTTLDTEHGSLRIRTAPSVLALRDAMLERNSVDWVIALTDRQPSELPTGVVDHLTVGTVSNLDPWPALRSRFHATGQEFDLLSLQNTAARAALRYLPPAPEPAPNGVLTSDHLFRVIAGHNFGFTTDPTPLNVAVWSTNVDRTAQFTAWQDTADQALLTEFYRWLEGRLSALGPVFGAVWQTVGPQRLVPLGLVAALLNDSGSAAAGFPATPEEIIRSRTLLEVQLGQRTITENQLLAWGNTASLAVADGADKETLRTAEDLVTQLQASALVGRSDVLRPGLTARLARFAQALDAAELDAIDLAAVENCWADVTAHRLARPDSAGALRDVRVGAATLRLLRWLRSPDATPSSTAGWLGHYRDDLSWVDGAVDEVFVGATDPQLADAAHRIVTAARARRAEQDRKFARHLQTDGGQRRTGADAPTYVEDLLTRVVLPLTRPRPGGSTPSPVLLIVADGMSGSSANELVADTVRRTLPQWTVCLPEDTEPVTVALSALPSVTEFSRCSLLSGRLARGGQSEERAGFDSWLTANGLPSAGRALFHKADMEAAARANALAATVQEAVDDTGGRPVIACVLNDVDDALDRSDPIGTVWTTDRFKRLDSLLSAAAAVGRTVVLVSDHGHVVERREQPSVQRGVGISARYRTADTDVAEDEVLVDGPRVLCDGHRAILAVDEQLRYTGLKAGYHGGGALAEVAIPVAILLNGAIPEHLQLIEASLSVGEPLAAPPWWEAGRDVRSPLSLPAESTGPATKTAPKRRGKSARAAQPAQSEGLFELADPAESGVEALPDAAPAGGRDRVAELLATELFTRLYKQYGRRTDLTSIATLLRETIDAGGVLPLTRAAHVLNVKAFRAGPAVQSLAQVLNTDGVIVLTVTGTELELEAETMFEQFGVPR